MPPRVAVIGAGVSGLRCAAVLLDRSVEVTIFEARDRIGGRIVQNDQMGEIEVDLGANWVHSTGFNPIIELARETNTPLHHWKENTLMLDPSGSLISECLANRTMKTVWDILEQGIEESKEKSHELPPDFSLFDYFRRTCDDRVRAGNMKPGERDLVLGMAQMWGAYVGDRVERQSMKFFFLEDCIDGDDCFIPSNYKRIMAEIAKKPLAEASFYYRTKVKAVEAPNALHAKVCVTLEGDQRHYFDDVIITTPLGWLKRHKGSIQPLLPRISQAIDSISFGRLEKVLIEFPWPFWETPELAAKEDDKARISFIHWLSPSYAPATNPQQWRLECVSFNAFAEPYRRNILLFYTFGDCSTHITDNICGLGPRRDRWLEAFFEPYYSRLPNYDKATCSPLRFLATEWCKDEFAGFGSYSNFQIGMEEAARDVEVLRYGMPQQHIYFAGEHTAPFDGLGTVAGAYTSGEKVAQRILEASNHRQSHG